MGLAPFGDPEVYADTVRRMATVDEDGAISDRLVVLRLSSSGVAGATPRSFSRAFGSPREGKEFEANHENVAAAFQVVA